MGKRQTALVEAAKFKRLDTLSLCDSEFRRIVVALLHAPPSVDLPRTDAMQRVFVRSPWNTTGLARLAQVRTVAVQSRLKSRSCAGIGLGLH